jgi:hypothetical protein
MGKQVCQDMRDVQPGWSSISQPPVRLVPVLIG